MFWADETINEILKRNDKKYLLTDYKTPSGKIHVGSLRGVLIHDALYRGLNDKNVSAEYWYGFDDFDPMDGLSDELKESFSEHMGKPLCNVPSPDGSTKNFAEYYANDFLKIIEALGVKAKIIWGSKLYKDGAYNKAIEIVLDNDEEIRKIYKEISGGQKPDNWFPFQVVCPNCGKIGSTKVTAWDHKQVEFTCEENLVQWAKGCGYQGKISPFNGNGKMPYKVETAAKWFSFNTSVELAGKDHYTKGGTFDIAKEIASKIFKIKPAYGFGYEWVLVGGKGMSTSKGVGSSASDISEILPSKLLRFLMTRTRAKRAIDFDPEGDTVPLLYDEYDRCAEAFSKDPKSDFGRAYYFSELNLGKELPKYFLRFSKIAYMLQMAKCDIFEYAKNEKKNDLTNIEKNEIEERIEIAKKWLKKFAPESYKFTILENPPKELALSDLQKEFLSKISDIIETKNLSGEELHQKIHEIKKEMAISPRDAFSAIYEIFLGKDSGPQAGWLLASLDRDFVLKRINQTVS